MIGKQQRIPPSAQTVRVQMAAQQQASAKNQRLALQMANRPSVQAALGSQDQVSWFLFSNIFVTVLRIFP